MEDYRSTNDYADGYEDCLSGLRKGDASADYLAGWEAARTLQEAFRSVGMKQVGNSWEISGEIK